MVVKILIDLDWLDWFYTHSNQSINHQTLKALFLAPCHCEVRSNPWEKSATYPLRLPRYRSQWQVGEILIDLIDLIDFFNFQSHQSYQLMC